MSGDKFLNLNSQKTCDCKENHLNCLTAKQWIKAQLGVWEFNYEKRDVRDKTIHPAVFPISLAKKVVSLFTHKGELVLDPFCGIGTTLIASRDLDRNAVGFDLKKEYCEQSNSRLSQETLSKKSNQVVICEDARNIPEYLKNETVKLAFTSPPYANLLNRQRENKSRRGKERKNEQYQKVEQYSQDSRDLGTLDIDDFQKELTSIYKGIFPLIKKGGHNVINVADVWWKGPKKGTSKRIPIHIYVHQAMLDAGFELKNTIIWDRRNIVNRIGIFGWPSNYITMGTTFEYILDFWKPK